MQRDNGKATLKMGLSFRNGTVEVAVGFISAGQSSQASKLCWQISTHLQNLFPGYENAIISFVSFFILTVDTVRFIII